MHISEELGQKYTVISVDQALYFKLIDLKWSVPRYKDSVFLRLGGLHIAMNNGGRSNLQRAWEVILCARIPLL
jgi:hypothetical protein